MRYTDAQQKAFFKDTKKYLAVKDLDALSTADLSVLEELVRFHEYRYYILNDSLISDYEYDQLYKDLEFIEQSNPGLVTPDSPTQRVAKGLTKEFPTVAHLVPMLSLDNSYNSDDLLSFDRKARESAPMNLRISSRECVAASSLSRSGVSMP